MAQSEYDSFQYSSVDSGYASSDRVLSHALQRADCQWISVTSSDNAYGSEVFLPVLYFLCDSFMLQLLFLACRVDGFVAVLNKLFYFHIYLQVVQSVLGHQAPEDMIISPIDSRRLHQLGELPYPKAHFSSIINYFWF